MFDRTKKDNEIKDIKYYADLIRHRLRIYPEDRRRLIIDNYKKHGPLVFKIFSEVNKK